MKTVRPKLRVLISGAGIAGILSAINLDYDFYKVSGFTLYGGQKIKLLAKLDSDGFAWVFNRAHLMEILEKVLTKKLSKNRIIFNQKIVSINEVDPEDHAYSNIKFSNGKQARYDLVIIAEGINFSTRGIVFEDEEVQDFKYQLKYEWFSTPTNLGSNGALFFQKGYIGVIHPPSSKNLLGYYFTPNCEKGPNYDFEIEVLDTIKELDNSKLGWSQKTSMIFSLKKIKIKNYFKDNFVLIGDSAHGQPPTLGFGTSLAIEDAVAISGILNSYDWANKINVELKTFSELRKKRVKKVYRFQNLIHTIMANNTLKLGILSFLLRTFLGKFIEKKIKRLASENEYKTV